MRRKTTEHSNVQSKSKSAKPLLKRTYVKVLSFVSVFSLIAVALIVPTTTLAPDVEAIANKKAIALGFGDLKDFSDVILSNCKVEVPTEPETQQETEATEPTTEPEETTEPETEATEAETEAVVTETEPEIEEVSTVISEVSASSANSNYLLSIDNPDLNYVPGRVTLSDSDRNLLERLVMGEAGSLGYTGCALIAQCVRDTMVLEGITSVSDVIARYNYSGSTSVSANSNAVSAVSFIFDENGSAVQHRILYMYESSICDSPWHESQNHVVTYGSVKFFDKW